MLKIYSIFIFFLLVGCSSTKLTDSWKNTSYNTYQPKKVLILGVTPNITARKLYESKLTTALNKRGIQGYEGANVLEPEFTNLKQAEKNIEKEVSNLSKLGFDAILIAAVKGYDERIPYKGNIFSNDDALQGFENYYFLNQDVYLDTGYYDKYKVFHIEISLYNITSENGKSLVWVASYDVINPKKIKTTIKRCNRAILSTLEKEGIIPEI
ncbi:hypothetical protein [Lutibacter flavus]|uniref:Lipoprotein n=1 Tax=Lutibacter flavus TaxID=691689 RepID=A0A238VF99_9FLAO|nr:hypothetical protein [Lutibacter flavus]SNR32844.1 hypothetical protein SAMN04488111_0378 [Lutibacter flavus]